MAIFKIRLAQQFPVFIPFVSRAVAAFIDPSGLRFLRSVGIVADPSGSALPVSKAVDGSRVRGCLLEAV
jgi:hypothetical protein